MFKMDALDIQKIVDELSAFTCTGSDLDSTNNPILSIVLVNWKTRDLLNQCIKSIYKNTKRTLFEIMVIDNNSRDGSAELVMESFQKVLLTVNNDNAGHAKAMNQAAKLCHGTYILFLNPDTIILDSALDNLVDFINAHPDTGAVTPKILGITGTLDKGCRRLKYTKSSLFFEYVGLSHLLPKSHIFGRHFMTCFDEDLITDVDIITGICMLVRKETLDKIGLFDEKFYLMIEDIDLSYRIRNAGWKIRYVPTAQIIHYHGQSTKQRNDIQPLVRSEYIYFFRKHYGLGMVTFHLLLRFLTTPIRFGYAKVIDIKSAEGDLKN